MGTCGNTASPWLVGEEGPSPPPRCVGPQARFHWSRIAPTDRVSLRDLIHQHRPNTTFYEDSWGYIIQATRHGGFKLSQSRGDFVAFFAYKSRERDTLVVPSFFGSAAQLAQAARLACAKYGLPVVLKNIAPCNAPSFRAYGFRGYENGEMWSPEAPFDDQTFPQVLVELGGLVHCQGGNYRKLRNVLNRQPCFELHPYLDTHREAVIELLRRKDRTARAGSGGLYVQSHEVYLDGAAHGLDRYVVVGNDRVRGFLAMSAITGDTVALCAAIFEEGFKETEGIKELTPWGIYMALSEKHREGYRFANLGGSESCGTFEFKRQTFNPSMLIHRTHLVWDGKTPQATDEKAAFLEASDDTEVSTSPRTASTASTGGPLPAHLPETA